MSLFIMPALFLALSIAFFFGKGAFLIAGYNTKTPAEREKFDKEHDVKKMCRATGMFMFMLAIMTAIIAYYQTQLVTLYCMTAIISMLLFFVTYINLGCKKY